MTFRALAAALLVAHGLVHGAVWLAPRAAYQSVRFDPARSWLLDVGSPALRSSSASRALALATGAAYATAGWLLLIDVDVWDRTALLACELGVILKLIWFHPWLVAGIAIDVAVMAAIAA